MSEQDRWGKILAESRALKNFQDPSGVRAAPWSPSEEETKTAGYDRWARMAPEIMSEPVISAKYLADQLSPFFEGGVSEELAREAFGDRVSMNDFIEITSGAAMRSRFGEQSERYAQSLAEKGMAEELIGPMVEKHAEWMEDDARKQIAAAKQSLITGKGTKRQLKFAGLALEAVSQHTPRGDYAQYAGRTPEQAAQADAQYGKSADFNLTPAGQQNYGAQRVMEFFSAGMPDYEPATAWGQAARIAGGVLSPLQRGIQEVFMGGAKDVLDNKGNNVYLDPFKDVGRIATPGGQFDFAADLAERSKGATNIYDQQGRANFLMNSALTPGGMGNAYINASYPIGYGINALFGNKQWGDFAGIAMSQGIGPAVEDAATARAIRTEGNRVTPRTIPGVSPEQMQQATRQMEKNDAGSDAYVSATLGPVLSDIMGVERSYLSPVGSGFFNILGELGADPINVAYTLGGPAAMAAGSTAKNISYTGGKTLFPPFKNAVIPHLKQGLQNYGKGVGKAVANLKGDIFDEGLMEPIQFGAPTVGLDALFQAQDSNALIDNFGNGKAPNEEGYDPIGANTERVVQRLQTTQPITEAMRRTRSAPTSMDYQRPPAGGRMQY